MMLYLLSLAAGGIFLVAMQQDVMHRRIPNPLTLVVLIIAVTRWLINGQIHEAVLSLVVAVMVLTVSTFLFARGWLGGGDVKLLSASCLLVGALGTIPLLFAMALIGGVISLALLAWTWVGRRTAASSDAGVASVANEANNDEVTVPYGVAIGLAALWVVFDVQHCLQSL
jgi:prepilin peptidase CpaA